MGRTGSCRRAVLRQGLGATLTLLLMLAWSAGLAWGAAGIVGGSAQPVPIVVNPVVGQQYDVQIKLSNTSISNSLPPSGPGIGFIAVNVASSGSPPSPDEVAHVILACSTAPCSGTNELPGTVAFVPVGPTGCVSAVAGVVSCSLDPLNSNRVIIKTNPFAVSLGPLQLNSVMATIRVQQVQRPQTFFMQADAKYQGIAGTCTGGLCTNVSPNNPASTSCTQNSQCDFAALAGAAVGTANVFPAASCGDGILDPGETCDPPGSVQPGGSICRNDCTFCGDGLVQGADGEACDDGNNVSGDGCSATCQSELCQIKVDKQVSCDGVNWTDAALVINNNDGTNGVTCPRNEPVFVRYQLQNTGAVDVANCTVGESNVEIAAGGTVLTAASLLAGAGVGPTNPLNPQCTDALAANEADTATASCDCQLSQGGPLTVTATDMASIACTPRCGDGIVDAGETCDPPGSVLPGGAICRNDCTFCGDGLLQAGDGEACDDGNNVSGDGCSATCGTELCQIQVDKQVSCDGVTWTDAALVINDNDGTNGVSCPRNEPVFVRYQVHNSGQVTVANCTLGESNIAIVPGGTVQSGFSLIGGADLGPTNPVNPQCTDALAGNEADTATASCECQLSQGGPLTVTATDMANIVCVARCGDGQLDPGETCDPPGTVEPNGNACRADCTFCGDGITQAGEACDPNNPADPVTAAGHCSATCTILPFCGDGVINPGETCDPPGSVLPGGAICRNDCTFCGDGIVQGSDGEACDDGNSVSGDGCSATCQPEGCSVKVDKQVSCDGVTWVDANGLETANEDGTGTATCPRNTQVFVRYQFANTGAATATCSSSESNPVIVPGGTIFTGRTLTVGAVVGPTNPRTPQCSDSLAANEPDTVTLSCTCPNGTGGIANAGATDTAKIVCSPRCGDGIVDPGETCDPPGSTLPNGAICRADCTACGDGVVQTGDGEACDDGNLTAGDGCNPTCQPESCQVKVDKQVSCDGVTWTDVGLEVNNEDGTNGVTCQSGAPVYVRYQVANTGEQNVSSCTLSESNAAIGSTVASGFSIAANTTMPPTAVDSDQTCTTTLASGEPDTATLTCQCAVPTNGSLTVTARDIASVACQVPCSLSIEKTCEVAAAPYVCTKPITSLTMRWDPVAPLNGVCVNISALVATGVTKTAGPVCPGETITINGYDGSLGNDVFWNLTNAATGLSVGQSTFHLSCSDVDMNTSDDCGKTEGNAKGTVACAPGGTNASCINMWTFEGMTGPAGSAPLACTASDQTDCEISPAPYVCTKPITSLTMRWNPVGSLAGVCVDISALVATGNTQTASNICPGQDVTISGYNGSLGNDVFWNLFNHATGAFVGQSSFHLSCSDVDMNTSDDCGKTEGNNKGTVACAPGGTNASCINQWIFRGMTGPAGSAPLDCNNPNGSSPVTYHYTVTNNTATDVVVAVTDHVTDSQGTTDVTICSGVTVPGNQSVTCDALDQIGEDTSNQATASDSTGTCTATSNTVTVTVTTAGTACPTSATTITAKDRDVKWKLTAPKTQAVEISKIEISFPAGDGDLKEVHLAGASIFKGSLSSPATITAFNGTAKDRSTDKGQTEELRFTFANKPVASTGYNITVTFTSGCTIHFQN